MIEFIDREASDSELLACVHSINERKTADRRDVVAIAREWGINPINGITTLVAQVTAPPPSSDIPESTPTAVLPPKVVEAVSITPPGSRLSRIGDTARSTIFAMLRNSPRTLNELGRKYEDHLFTFWHRGEVTFDGNTYSIKEKA